MKKSFGIRLAKGLLLAMITTTVVALIMVFIALEFGAGENYELILGFVAGTTYWVTLLSYVFYHEINN